MIGIFDSGVGGLYALREARRRMPQADLVYFADEANLPYGDKDPKTILRLSRAAVERLADAGATAILAACGTVGSVALPALQKEFRDLPILGILDPLAQAVAAAHRLRGGGILLLGTRATVQAGVLERKICSFATHAPLFSLACPGFVPLAEAGICDPENKQDRAAVAAILHPATAFPVHVVALGCTHFSCLAPIIRAVMPRAAIIDGAREGAAAWVHSLPDAAKQGEGTVRYLSSGDPAALARAAGRVMGETKGYAAF